MKEKITGFQNAVQTAWSKRTKNQKIVLISSIIITAVLIAAIILFTTNKKMVPLYNNLTLQEAGQINTELDTRGIPYELQDGGTTITVPEEDVDTLLVDLAGQGLPHSGNIDYSFFSENSSWGVTDNEFNIMKLDAMQTELAYLMKSIEGIEDAKVMINMPKDPVLDRKSTRLNSSHVAISYAVFCLHKKK